ncbi:MAG: MCE family protein [Treponema sp.]|nr:MCE family protein [Treponema sp.]
MKIYLKLVLLILIVFLVTSCESFAKKTFFYANLDFNTRLSTKSPIYYGGVIIGRVTEILVLIEEKEKRIKFFIFEDYRTIAREGTKIIFKIDNDNIVKWIDISPDIDFKNSDMLPEEGYFISIMEP